MHGRATTVLLVAILVAACSASGTATDTPQTQQQQTQAPRTPMPTASRSAEPTGLVLVALGDSIPFNSPDDCPGCIGYVDQYGKALETATGDVVRVVNLADHSGLTSEGLLRNLKADTLRAKVAGADAITISIGFNDAPMLLTDDPCDGPAEEPPLATYTSDCITAWADAFGQRLTRILGDVHELRAGKPTLVTVINVFDQWLGFAGNSAAMAAHIDVVRMVLEEQNKRICAIARTHGALCADLHSAFNGPHHDKPSATLLGADYAHPSQSGNDLIARTLIELGLAPLR